MAGDNQGTDSETANSSSGSSNVSFSNWPPPLRDVNIGVSPSYAAMLEEQQQKIKHLQDELSEFNRLRYQTLPVTASRGKNVMRTAKKVSMTAQDHLNTQTIASYLRQAVWPTNKLLPKNWSKWRDDRRSLCQMILQKVALPVGVDGKSYWESMLLGITNDKFCSLRSNFKQEMFEQFQGE